MFDNPVMWMELGRLAARRRRRPFSSLWAVPLVVAFAGLLLLHSSGVTFTGQGTVRYLRGLPVIGLWLYLLGGSSRARVIGAELLKEFSQRSFEVLSVTMLEPRSILWGNLQAHVVAGLSTSMLFFPFWVVACALADWPWYWLVAGPATGAAATFFFGAAALCGTIIASWANAGTLIPGLVWGLLVGCVLPRRLTPSGLTWLLGLALVAMPVLLVGGLMLFWLAAACLPWRLNRLFERTAGPAARPKVGSWLVRPKPRKMPLGPYDDPFYWQEARRPMWTRVVTYIVLGGLTLPFFAIGALFGSIEIAAVAPLWVLAGFGAPLVSLMSLDSVMESFQAERTKRTAEALILTGRPPEDILRGKLRAWQRFVLPVAVTVGVAAVVAMALGVRGAPAGLRLLVLLLGPVFPWYGMRLVLLVGVISGITCRSTKEAGQFLVPWLVVLAVASLVWTLYAVPGAPPFVVPWRFVAAGLVTGVGLLAGTFRLGSGARREESWRPWRLGSAMLGEALVAGGVLCTLGNVFSPHSVGFGLTAAFAVTVLGYFMYGRWWKLAVRTFEAAMLQPVAESA